MFRPFWSFNNSPIAERKVEVDDDIAVISAVTLHEVDSAHLRQEFLEKFVDALIDKFEYLTHGGADGVQCGRLTWKGRLLRSLAYPAVPLSSPTACHYFKRANAVVRQFIGARVKQASSLCHDNPP